VLADAQHLQILNEDGVTNMNQNSNFLYNHFFCPMTMLAHNLLQLSHSPHYAMLQAIHHVHHLPTVHNHLATHNATQTTLTGTSACHIPFKAPAEFLSPIFPFVGMV
jgi:hypothetical protein